MTKTEIIYLAGFIDGEGCIYLKRKSENSTWLQLMLNISQKDIGLLSELKEMIGEKGYLRKPTKSYSAGSLAWSSGQAYRIIKLVYPYLRLKKEQAKIAIEFFEKYRVIPKGRPNRNPDKKIESLPIWKTNPRLWENREMCFHAIKLLKGVQYATTI